MLGYQIGLSSIRANQIALQTIANNIANANTPGYHRQRVDFTNVEQLSTNGLFQGAGVSVTSLERVRDAAIENSLLANSSAVASTQTAVEVFSTIEQLFLPGEGSLNSAVSNFFAKSQGLASHTADGTAQREFVAAAEDLGRAIRSVSAGIEQIRASLNAEIQSTVGEINQLSTRLSALRAEINQQSAIGKTPHALLDEQDRLAGRLAELVDLNPASLDQASGPIVAAGGWLVIGEQAAALKVDQTNQGTFVRLPSGQGPVVPQSGKLSALLDAVNTWLPSIDEMVSSWSETLVSEVNSLHAGGLSATGLRSFTGEAGAQIRPDLILKNANTLRPVSEGSFYLSVTEAATGNRVLHRIDVNPQADSLNEILAEINTLPNITSSINPQTGKVSISTPPGFTLDFAGRPPTSLDLSSFAGTAVPTISGQYSGSANARWSVTALSTGEVGVTPDLRFRVTDLDTGATITEVNVGQGYGASTPIPLADGITLNIGPGTITAGDSFQVDAVGRPDETGLLSALGLNSLFTGTGASLQVREEIRNNPGLLSFPGAGQSGAGSTIARLMQFRDSRIFSSGTETVEERLATMTSIVGIAAQGRQAEADQLSLQQLHLQEARAAVSGVDANEELLSMLEFQRSFQATSKFMAALNESLDNLLNLII